MISRYLLYVLGLMLVQLCCGFVLRSPSVLQQSCKIPHPTCRSAAHLRFMQERPLLQLDSSSTSRISPIAKQDFPLLISNHGQKSLTYLDSAATSQKPQAVLDSLTQFYGTSNANVHRGAYRLANKATELYETSRQRVQHFLNAKYYEEIVFTRSATEAINLVAFSYAEHLLQSGDEILLTVMEHHSNLIPWQLLAKRKGLILRFASLTEDKQELDMKSFAAHFPTTCGSKCNGSNKIKLVALSHVSNILGNVNPIEEVIDIAHRHGAVVLLDACQSVPHMPIDVQALDVDFLAASSHKMCGPFGLGFLYAKKELLSHMPPFQGGGQMIDQVSLFDSTFAPPPFRFEAGTPAIGEAVGLSRAIDYLTKDIGGMQKIWEHEQALGQYLYHALLDANIPGLTIYGSQDLSKRTGIVSFNIEGLHGMDIAMLLDQYGICIRNGHHCAQPLHEVLGVASSMRASVYFYNGQEDVDYFVSKLKEVVNMLKSFVRQQ